MSAATPASAPYAVANVSIVSWHSEQKSAHPFTECSAITLPFISPAAQWLLEEHEVFQGYYYFHHLGGDRDAREALRGHAHFNATARWCDEFDQVSFDPTYPSLPLEAFEPMVERVLARAPYWWDPAHLKRAAVTG